MTDLIKQIAGDLQKQIEGFEPELSISDIGTVVEAGDGIARVHGLANVKAQELVQFSNGVMGTAFNLARGVQFFTPLIITWVASVTWLGTNGGLGLGISIGAFFALFTGLWVWTLPETRGTRVLAADVVREAATP